jgi:integrase
MSNPPSFPPPVASGNDLVPADAVEALALKQQHAALLAAATSANTRRTYQSAIRHFLAWGGLLPADEGAIIRYMLACAETHNPRTVALRITALSRWHVHQDFRDPTATTTVRKTLLGIARTHGKPRRQAKALPVEDLDRISEVLSKAGTLRAVRDNALLQVGFFGGFRRSELVAIRVQHISWETEGVTITLPRSKTDQTGEGIVKALPYGSGLRCPVTALRIWLEQAGLTDGFVFRSISRWGRIQPDGLHASSVNGLLSAAASQAGLAYAPSLSSHSLRRGMATSARRAGAGFQEIKKQGGWRHDGTVHGYIEEADRFSENAAGALLRGKPKGGARADPDGTASS